MDDVVLHLQNAHPVRLVGPRALRQDLLHAGAAGASRSLGHLETPGGDTLIWGGSLEPHTGVQRDVLFVTMYFYSATLQAFYTSWLNSS